jgi:hypothetical protein
MFSPSRTKNPSLPLALPPLLLLPLYFWRRGYDAACRSSWQGGRDRFSAVDHRPLSGFQGNSLLCMGLFSHFDNGALISPAEAIFDSGSAEGTIDERFRHRLVVTSKDALRGERG